MSTTKPTPSLPPLSRCHQPSYNCSKEMDEEIRAIITWDKVMQIVRKILVGKILKAMRRQKAMKE